MLVDRPQFMVFLLVLMRMSGFVALNPLFRRQGIPGIFRTGLILLMTLVIYPSKAAYPVALPAGALDFGMTLLLEFSMGVLVAFVIEVFFFVLTFAGSIIDFQMGLGMAKAYDPMTNTSAAVTGSLFSTFFYLFFFASNGHLALLRIFMTADRLVPYGQVSFGPDVADAALALFVQCALLGVQMAFPIIAIEFLAEVAVGIMTKVTPQVNIFVINIQAKVIIGMLMLMFLSVPIGEHINNLVTEMIREIQSILRLMA